MGLSERAIHFQCLQKRRLSPQVVTLSKVQSSQFQMDIRQFRLELKGFEVVSLGLVVTTRPIQGAGVMQTSGRMVPLEVDCLSQMAHGILKPSRLSQEQAKVQVGGEEFGIQRQNLVIPLDGLRLPAELGVAECQVEGSPQMVGFKR